MSEKLHNSGEKLVNNIDTSAESEKNLERLREAAKNAEQDPLQKHVESLSRSAEAQAISGAEHNIGDKQGESSAQSFGTTKDLKTDAYKRTLRKVRGQLNAPQRAFSRVVHQPIIDNTSNALSKTVARPSAFLGAGLGALVGSSILLYISRKNGFTYNYTTLFVLFAGGFMLGLLLELLFKLVVRKKSL